MVEYTCGKCAKKVQEYHGRHCGPCIRDGSMECETCRPRQQFFKCSGCDEQVCDGCSRQVYNSNGNNDHVCVNKADDACFWNMISNRHRVRFEGRNKIPVFEHDIVVEKCETRDCTQHAVASCSSCSAWTCNKCLSGGGNSKCRQCDGTPEAPGEKLIALLRNKGAEWSGEDLVGRASQQKPWQLYGPHDVDKLRLGPTLVTAFNAKFPDRSSLSRPAVSEFLRHPLHVDRVSAVRKLRQQKRAIERQLDALIKTPL